MSERLPSLGALRAFEAAARHMSLTRAAEELHVTPAAVSHQVKALENDLGIRLFDRENRCLVPTPDARSGLNELRRGFDFLAEGVRRIRESRMNPILRVTTEPTFGGSWLVPRLSAFRTVCPDLDILIDASDRLVDFERDPIDIGVRWGGGRYPGLVAEQLFGDEEVIVVCPPSLLDGDHPLREPDDLQHHLLIHLDWPVGQGDWPDWPKLLKEAGATAVDGTRGLHFTAHSHAIRAARDSRGAVLATRSLVNEDLRSGALVEPFDITLPTGTRMFLVYRRDRAGEPAIASFRSWIVEAAAHDAAAWGRQTERVRVRVR
ncbi:MAG: transcriptional regulator GcvA [Rhodospirillales bacterium]|nr:transcriptional regulator GcvA [Rhodospirillales bacterium]